METLIKREHEIFKDYYVGTNGNKTVTVVMDEYCTRYIVYINGKQISKKEYSNEKRHLCFPRAIAQLNK
jgi:hypothetical protein